MVLNDIQGSSRNPFMMDSRRIPFTILDVNEGSVLICQCMVAKVMSKNIRGHQKATSGPLEDRETKKTARGPREIHEVTSREP